MWERPNGRREICPSCGRDVSIRLDGCWRKHNSNRGEECVLSGQRPEDAQRGAPKPFLVTDSPTRAKDILRVDFRRRLNEFRVIWRADGLRAVQGDVYTLYTGTYALSTALLWEELARRVALGVIRDLGGPAARPHA